MEKLRKGDKPESSGDGEDAENDVLPSSSERGPSFDNSSLHGEGSDSLACEDPVGFWNRPLEERVSDGDGEGERTHDSWELRREGGRYRYLSRRGCDAKRRRDEQTHPESPSPVSTRLDDRDGGELPSD